MKANSVILMCVVLAVFALDSSIDSASARQVRVYVDDSAAPGGDGSEQQPVRTIQEGIALLPKRGGTVFIHPGTYIGPILVDRDGVVLWGLAGPVYDADGFLAGFDEEVVITNDRPLEPEDLATGREVEDLVELRGSDNEVHNIVIHLRAVNHWLISGVSAKAEDGDFYDNIVISHVLARGYYPNVVWTAKANTTIEYITSLEPGLVGLSTVAHGHVEIRKAYMARKAVNACFVGIWEYPREENGPSLLTAAIRDCKLENADGVVGFAQGVGLWVLPRAGRVNPAEPSTIILEATGNTFQGNLRAVQVRPLEGTFSTEETHIDLSVADNTYVDNVLADVEVRFRSGNGQSRVYAANATVRVQDGDGVFPDAADVDLGPQENGNSYVLIQD